MELREAFLSAMEETQSPIMYATTGSAVPPMKAMDIWGLSIPAILRVLLEKARELGRDYRPQLEAAAQGAVDSASGPGSAVGASEHRGQDRRSDEATGLRGHQVGSRCTAG